MRIPVNLASRPLENLRLVRTGVAVAGIAALLFATIIVRHELRNRSEFQALIQKRSALTASLSDLHNEQQELEGWLYTPQAEQIRARSGFLNSLILRKSLSWTQMFMDLEKILPPRVRITSIRPTSGTSGEADLELSASAESMTPLVEFLKNLENSPKFGPPTVGAQKYSADRSAEGGVAIALTTRYLQQRSAAPAGAPTATPEAGPGAGEEIEENVAQQTGQESETEAGQ